MKKKEQKVQRIADALDVPLNVLSDIPRIELMGKSSLSIENFRGILDYGENSVKVNTTVGIVEIKGQNLFIESITDEGILIKGSIESIVFI